MSDIVDRLRASSHQHKDARAIRLEAADEITRLRARVEELEGALEGAVRTMKSVSVFVTSREQINKTAGVKWWTEMKDSARRALRGETDG